MGIETVTLATLRSFPPLRGDADRRGRRGRAKREIVHVAEEILLVDNSTEVILTVVAIAFGSCMRIV